MAKRGRQPEACPDQHELRIAYAFDPRIAIVARQMDANPKQVRRWLGELGIELPEKRKQRARGVTPRYFRLAYLQSGRRVECALYHAWANMRYRCNSSLPNYLKWYKAKGVKVCDEWNDYDAFRKWALANGFRKGLTLDREDGDGDYEPLNCRWIPKGDQQENVGSAITLTLNGETRSLYRWARIVGLSADLLRTRYYNGWTAEQILTTPRLTNGQVRAGVQHQPRGRKPKSAVPLGYSSKEGQ